MNLSSGTLQVHNSWFFGDAGYVHLGSNVQCSTGSRVVTSLANRLLGDGRDVHVQLHGQHAALLLAKGNHSYPAQSVQWVWHASAPARAPPAAAPPNAAARGGGGGGSGVGYIPISTASATAPTLHVNNDERSGNWSELGTGTGSSTVETLEVQLSHGRCNDLKQPDQAGSGFGYAVLPDIAFADVGAAVAAPPWTVLSNTAEVQAVGWAEKEGGGADKVQGGSGYPRVQAVFWNPTPTAQQGESEGEGARACSTAAPLGVLVGSSAPSIVMAISSNGSNGSSIMRVSASSPLARVRSVNVTVLGSWTGAGCSDGPRVHLHAPAHAPLPTGTDCNRTSSDSGSGTAASAAAAATTIFGFELPEGDSQGKTVTVECRGR